MPSPSELVTPCLFDILGRPAVFLKKMEEKRIWRRREEEKTWRSGRNVLFERRINNKKKERRDAEAKMNNGRLCLLFLFMYKCLLQGL